MSEKALIQIVIIIKTMMIMTMMIMTTMIMTTIMTMIIATMMTAIMLRMTTDTIVAAAGITMRTFTVQTIRRKLLPMPEAARISFMEQEARNLQE